jgi:hypothetical protein
MSSHDSFVFSCFHSRGMAGAFPSKYAVKKNIFIEEWNGKREITEKSFEMGYAQVPTFIIYCLVFPYGIYTLTRTEFLKGTDRRYKDVF